MPRSRRPVDMEQISRVLGDVLDFDEGASVSARLAALASLRQGGDEASSVVDQLLLREHGRLRGALLEARGKHQEMRDVIDKLSAPPYYPAMFLALEETSRGPAALVFQGGTRRVVLFGEGVDPETLTPGDELLLGAELNLVMERSPYGVFRGGETALFDRDAGDGRMVVRVRDEELVIDRAATLEGVELAHGDLVRWDRALFMGFEKVDPSRGDHLFLEEMPEETFDAIGGLDDEIERIKEVISLHYRHRKVAARHRLTRRGSILLTGPPGNGKTMIARAVAWWLGVLFGSGRARFMNIKPGELHSEWYSVAERNYRETFRMAREAAEREPDVPVVLFFDELDSVARQRGTSISRVGDDVLNALMVELDGLAARGNVLVIGATNRPEALDFGMLRFGRMKDLMIEIPRPGAVAARSIFERYIPEDQPVAGDDPVAAREAVLDTAVARIYGDNADSRLARLQLQDGTSRTVRKRDLMSGATAAKICLDAKERAAYREIEGDPSGLRPEDLVFAVEEEFERTAALLTPQNCHHHVDGLPQNVAVVGVDTLRRRVQQPRRYRRIA